MTRLPSRGRRTLFAASVGIATVTYGCSTAKNGVGNAMLGPPCDAGGYCYQPPDAPVDTGTFLPPDAETGGADAMGDSEVDASDAGDADADGD